MITYRKLLLLTTMSFFLLALSGCGNGSSDGGDVTVITPTANQPTGPVPEDPSGPSEPSPPPNNQPTDGGFRTLWVNNTDPLASDLNDGIATTEGGSGPFATISYGLSKLQPGDHLYIQATELAYSADSAGGYTIKQLAIDEQSRVVIEGVLDASGNLPIIDLGKTSFSSAKDSTVGLLLDCVSFITIKNLEIRNATNAGISTSLDGCASEGIILENNHIHHIYGHELTAGIRLSKTTNASLFNNKIHDVFSAATTTRQSTPLGPVIDSPAIDSSTVDISGVIVKQSEISNVDTGVAIRQQSARELTDLLIEDNQFQDVSKALRVSARQGSTGPVGDLHFTNNLVVTADHAIQVELSELVLEFPYQTMQGLNITDNTFAFIAQGPVIELTAAQNVSVYNNIFYQSAKILTTGDAGIYGNRIEEWDYNLYHNPEYSWVLEKDTALETHWLSLADWQAETLAHTGLITTPDTHANEGDPRFVQAANFDFSLLPDSPAIGAGKLGSDIGYKVDSLP